MANAAIGVVFDHTLGMTTAMANDRAGTAMSRWEATAAYSIEAGPIAVAPMLGFGHRGFSIESADPSRSPDSDYNYLLAGATVSLPLGSRVALAATAAFQPVLFGEEPTEMAFGEARRWGVDVGAAVEVHPVPHFVVRAAADYQRFSWSFDMAGARGAGGATDSYPSGILTLGATY
jgi:hypothetical protein